MLLSLLLISAQAVQNVPAREADWQVNLFIEACIDGKLTIKKNEIEEIQYSDLPPIVRRRYLRGYLGSYYRIEGERPAYLVSRDYNSNPRHPYTSACAIASPDLEFRRAFEVVMEAILGRDVDTNPEVKRRSFRQTTLSLEHQNFEEGYIFSSKPHGASYTILQISHLKEAERLEMKQKFKKLIEKFERERDSSESQEKLGQE